jgi:hypothetical protein
MPANSKKASGDGWKEGQYNHHTLDFGFVSASIDWRISRSDKNWIVRCCGTKIGSWDNFEEAKAKAEEALKKEIAAIEREAIQAKRYLYRETEQ